MGLFNKFKNLFKKEEKDEEELQKYSNKKQNMYDWYKSLNKFLQEVDKLK